MSTNKEHTAAAATVRLTGLRQEAVMVRRQHAVGTGVTRAVFVLETGCLLGHQQRDAAQRRQAALAGRVSRVVRVALPAGGVRVHRVAAVVAHHLRPMLQAQRRLQAVRQVQRGLLSPVEPASMRHRAQRVVAAS